MGADHEATQVIAASVVELIVVLALLMWLYLIRPDFVEDASAAYAKRFLEQCEPKRTVGKSPVD